MARRLFGFTIRNLEEEQQLIRSPVVKEYDDSAIEVGTPFGAMQRPEMGDVSAYKSENTLINKYRDAASSPVIDTAIEEIISEAIVNDDLFQQPVNLKFPEKSTIPTSLQKVLGEELNMIMDMLDFRKRGHDVFRRWYVDGRLYFHKVLDEANPAAGIQQLRYIDPRKIKLVRETYRDPKIPPDEFWMMNTKQYEYWIFSDTGIDSNGQSYLNQKPITGDMLQMAKDSIAYVTSGLFDPTGKMVIGHLHKILRTLNQFRMLEDSLIIYRLTRAPERRKFKISVGNLPKAKAEASMLEMMRRFKNKLSYNASTGEVSADRRFIALTEDYWFAVRDGEQATDVENMEGGCLAMDTKIPLLDGRTLTLAEMTEEFQAGKTNWVYSCDPVTGRVAPGVVSWAGVTQESTKVLRLTLDNGQSIVCTPDHKFPVHGREFVRADALLVGDSMIAHNTKKEKIKKNTKDYEMVYQHDTKKWEFTHRMVRDSIPLKSLAYGDQEPIGVSVVHHLDCNRFNNNPENLVIMDGLHHHLLHADRGFTQEEQRKGTIAAAEAVRKMKLEDPEKYQEWLTKISNRSKKFWSTLSSENAAILRKKMSQGLSKHLAELDDGARQIMLASLAEKGKIGNAAMCEKMADFAFKADWMEKKTAGWKKFAQTSAAKERGKKLSESGKRRFADPIYKEQLFVNQRVALDRTTVGFVQDILIQNPKITARQLVDQFNKTERYTNYYLDINKDTCCANWDKTGITYSQLVNGLKKHGYETFYQFRKEATQFNHKIVGIEWLDDAIQVGTLTIDQDEVHHAFHTFALCAGIFTKNSQLGEISDLELFRDELYNGLNVPVARLDPRMSPSVDFSSQGTTISREELKFARFINRLRTRFSMLFEDLLSTQVVLKGIMTREEWDEVKHEIVFDFVRDSFYSELKELEIIGVKVQNLLQVDALVGKYVSKDWAQRNILGWDDKTIQEENTQMEAEAIQNFELQAQQNEIMGEIEQEEEAGVLPTGQPGQPQPGAATTSMAVPQMEAVNPKLQSAIVRLLESVAAK